MKKSFTIQPYCVEFKYSSESGALTDCAVDSNIIDNSTGKKVAEKSAEIHRWWIREANGEGAIKTSFCYVKSMKYPLKGQENVAFEKRAEDYYKKILEHEVTRAATHQISFHISLQDGCQFVKELILLANGLHSGGNSTVRCKWDCPLDSDMKLHEGEDYAIIMNKDVCTVNKRNSINGYRITLQVLRNRKVYLVDLGFAQNDYPFTNGEFLTVPYDYNKMEIAKLTEDLLKKYEALERVERVGTIEMENGLIEW